MLPEPPRDSFSYCRHNGEEVIALVRVTRPRAFATHTADSVHRMWADGPGTP